MALSKEERNRILTLVETGRISALEAAQLLDALETEVTRPPEAVRERTLRIRATSLNRNKQRKNFIASMPVQLLKTSFRLGGYLLPQLDVRSIEDVLRAIEEGNTGRLLDIQDLEQGERLEVFVE
ncbi:SHOCT-like domain-containing protein [Dictyobacter kobayashii]|uniref:YvlB/LiaX N-terminal domain-containing protein n=1 Tax=Dictyobacter kobayashii TaxID=2014872 RepID=A0A402AL07_9CHLR|nr:hypothetical protein [Dictyobacter kobayashii]GCE19807.1 hypothetical protein KDK_36070 [Dictyobacter kobayashii]